MSRPILAVDVDGVISLFGFDEPPARDDGPVRAGRRDGALHLAAGRASGCGGWPSTTSWSGRPAGRTKPTSTCRSCSGCRSCPTSPSTAPPASAPRTGSWGRSTSYGKGRAMAWIDDNFDESCYEWARAAGRADPAGPDRAGTSASRRRDRSARRLGPRPRARRPRPERLSTLSAVTGFWPIFFLLVVLKIPVLGAIWLVWWASQPAPEPEGAPRTPTAASSAGRGRSCRGDRAAGRTEAVLRCRCRACPPGGRTRVVRPAAQPAFARAGSRADRDGSRPRPYDA